MATDRETQKSRFHAFVNSYVEHVGEELMERSFSPANEDFIDGLTREVGYGLEDLLFDAENFSWSEDSAMISKLRDAEIGCIIAVLSLAVIACRCARKNDMSLLSDAASVFPVGGEFANELSAFVSGGMFTESGKISNVWARTHDLLPSWIEVRKSKRSDFRQYIENLAQTAEAGAQNYVAQAKVARDASDQWVKELPKAFSQQSGSGDESGCGCIFFVLAIIGGTIYYFFFR